MTFPYYLERILSYHITDSLRKKEKQIKNPKRKIKEKKKSKRKRNYTCQEIETSNSKDMR